MADKFITLLFTAALFCIVTEISDALRCYGCYDGETNDDCQSSLLLLNVSESIRDLEENKEDVPYDLRKYHKECQPDLNQTMCVVETFDYTTTSTYLSYIRDCSDGETFSFSNSPTFSPSQLANLPSNNQTYCQYVSSRKHHICVTLCVGDLCNGPQMRPVVDCNNKTNENMTVCGASSLTPFSPHGYIPIFGEYSIIIPFLIYTILILTMVY